MRCNYIFSFTCKGYAIAMKIAVEKSKSSEAQVSDIVGCVWKPVPVSMRV